jgi:hypothetical protein
VASPKAQGQEMTKQAMANIKLNAIEPSSWYHARGTTPAEHKAYLELFTNKTRIVLTGENRTGDETIPTAVAIPMDARERYVPDQVGDQGKGAHNGHEYFGHPVDHGLNGHGTRLRFLHNAHNVRQGRVGTDGRDAEKRHAVPTNRTAQQHRSFRFEDG